MIDECSHCGQIGHFFACPVLWATKKERKSFGKYPVEIEEKTAELWLGKETIKITEFGNENTYYIDQFDNEFFCKNYPDNCGVVIK